MDNGFDDYSLVFEPVDFYYDGVNQTKRYLEVTKDGVATVKQTPDPIWGAETDAQSHSCYRQNSYCSCETGSTG